MSAIETAARFARRAKLGHEANDEYESRKTLEVYRDGDRGQASRGVGGRRAIMS